MALPTPFFAQVALLRRERGVLEEEIEGTRLDPSEARERLLERVKGDTARIQVREPLGCCNVRYSSLPRAV